MRHCRLSDEASPEKRRSGLARISGGKGNFDVKIRNACASVSSLCLGRLCSEGGELCCSLSPDFAAAPLLSGVWASLPKAGPSVGQGHRRAAWRGPGGPAFDEHPTGAGAFGEPLRKWSVSESQPCMCLCVRARMCVHARVCVSVRVCARVQGEVSRQSSFIS